MKKLVGLFIGLAVGVLMVGSVLMPIINDASDDQRTVFNNEVSTKYSLLYDDVDSINATIVWDAFNDSEIDVTLNGESYTYALGANNNALIMSDKLLVRADNNASAIRVYIAGETSVGTQVAYTAPITITLSNGTITLTDSAIEPVSVSVTPTEWVFIPNVNGNYEFVRNVDGSAYINDPSQIYFSTIIDTDSKGFVWGNGKECTFYDTDTSYDMDVALTKVDGYTDLYSVNLNSVFIDESAGTNADGSQFNPYLYMIPVSVDAHTELNNSVLSMLAAIPVMFVISLLVISVTVILRRD